MAGPGGRTSLQLCVTVGYGICRNLLSARGFFTREFIHMTFARRLRFRASLLKIGADGMVGVARDRATAYGYALTGKETAPATDFDPFSTQTMRDPTRDTLRC